MATRILVVDDSPTIRAVVSTILERCGYDARVACDGQDAFEALASGEVKADLVLLDFVMPRMNGYEFCKALRSAANPELQATPVVLMSARADHIKDQFVEQTGALDAITKPFDREALVAVIENVLRRVNTKANRTSSARLPVESAASSSRMLEAAAASSSRMLVSDAITGAFPDTPGPSSVEGPNAEAGWGTVVAASEEESRREVTEVVAKRLAALAARAIADRPGLNANALVAALTEQFTGEALPEIVELLGDLDRVERGRAILAGDLGVVPIGAVLQLLQAENQTGILVCTSTSQATSMRTGEPLVAEVRATFREGEIDLVQSTGAGDEFRLGRFFVDEGILTMAEIDAFTAELSGASGTGVPIDLPSDMALTKPRPGFGPSGTQEMEAVSSATPLPEDEPAAPNAQDAQGARATQGKSSLPLGMALLEAGKIKESQLRSALMRQSSELLCEVIRWPGGRFELRRDPPSGLAVSAKLGLPVASVVMEGFRRVDEWRAIERTLGSFDAILFRDDAAFGSLRVETLPLKEKAVLDVVDGHRSARAIVAASHLSSFEGCRILAQFLEARVLRRRGR